MKAAYPKTPENTEQVSSHPAEKALGRKKGIETPLCQRKTEGGLEKRVANFLNGRKITKKAHAGRAHESKWEYQLK
ncbi:MAG: hypothetical protein ABSC18_16670 [Verrucomicrobiota bacterium]|jgi:hypothetical protein